ncbi:hypothetical protein HNQ51_002260 [Inhella inkyongensis]|uniref:Uncharacterized protein TP-0789 domain-containing protein n=1 Tax=Inhella inkyongensis TaxID=392593 RepID=A0A840S8S8_9BURK|nr:outer membrane lipoprotein-sorting protein [Inhella inkyongensis]MBB5204941.1 hypothetical protein [Inhella inkyongensis]
MNRRSLLSLGLNVGLLTLSRPLWAQEDAAARAEALWTRYRQGVQTEQEWVRVRIERAGQAPELKRLQRSIRYRADGGFLVLVRFAEPALDQGLTLLIDRSASSQAMWLRMPSWPQARRIAGDREARSFGGTDLSFEDNRLLLGEAPSDWSYRTLPDGRLEASPKSAGVNSAYGRRLLRLNTEGALAQIEYFDPNGRLLKTQTHEGLKVEANGRWRAQGIRVQHAQGSSHFEIERREFGAALPEAWFQAQLSA